MPPYASYDHIYIFDEEGWGDCFTPIKVVKWFLNYFCLSALLSSSVIYLG